MQTKKHPHNYGLCGVPVTGLTRLVYTKGITGYEKSSTPSRVHAKSKQTAPVNVHITSRANKLIQEW